MGEAPLKWDDLNLHSKKKRKFHSKKLLFEIVRIQRSLQSLKFKDKLANNLPEEAVARFVRLDIQRQIIFNHL